MIISNDQYVNLHAHRTALADDEWVLTNVMAEDYPLDQLEGVNYSIGLHPWNIPGSDYRNLLKKINVAAENQHVLGIGETGLDKVCETPFPLQQEIFLSHVEIAGNHGLPLIIHCVKAYNELINLCSEQTESIPMIIHGFRGSLQLACELIEKGFSLSFGAYIMRTPQSIATLEQLPVNTLFIESDESDTDIKELYNFVADIKGISVSALKDNIIERSRKIFHRTPV